MPSIPEYKRVTTAPYPNAVGTFTNTLVTDLQPSDVIVAIVIADAPGNILTVSGLGNTWQTAVIEGKVRVFYCTNKTGANNVVSVYNAQQVLDAQDILFVILRGLNQPILGGVQSSNNATQDYPAWKPIPPQNHSDGCIALAIFADMANNSGSSIVTDPTTDWADLSVYADSVNKRPTMLINRHIGIVPIQVTAKLVHATPNFQTEAAVVVFGQPIMPTPFKGWGSKL